MSKSTFRDFLKRKQINISVQTYLIDALGAMAFGLFASLLIGTIFATLGDKTHIEMPKAPREQRLASPLPML